MTELTDPSSSEQRTVTITEQLTTQASGSCRQDSEDPTIVLGYN